MKNKTFSLSSYKYLIKIIKKSKKPTINFDQFIDGKNGILMRHDVDFSLSKAFQIAKIDHKYAISSTFFVMLNSKIYSLSRKNLNYIKDIILLGHKIGLHFDASLYSKTKFSLEIECKNECKVLEELINYKINIISFHRPEKKFIGRKTKIAERHHTYMPLFIKNIKYCSDSQGKWRFDDPEELISDSTINNIQLLTHPIWWTTPANMSPGEKIAFFLKGKGEGIKREAVKNCKPYKLFIESERNT